MYLTRFRFNTARRESRRLLGRTQFLHAAVLHAFPEPERLQSDEGRILWRLDQSARHDAALYIASPEEPDLTHLVEQAGWPTRSDGRGWETRPYGKLLAALELQQQWGFRLTANPVHYVRRKPDLPKQRLAHVTPRQQLQWLLDRCESHGFTIHERPDGSANVTVHDRDWLRFTKSSNGGESRGGEMGNRTATPVTIRRATFDGVLTVEDPDKLRRALVCGIGRAKAYGCGMLTLAPLAGSS
ncbi:type I-E CRISPR-associated protein Cas6/Cse3/CasE [Glycomyces sp. NPDC046736]|uniref:type I-E CRISPR-associated protein Cas6/Cse3/CasE n=1 Tax=Glycomyces sp. NPDC046736 TaxID=3155615 RepID=UPI00340D357E